MRILVTGDGFLYNMVRILAGTLLAVGMGRLEPKAVATIIAGKRPPRRRTDRKAAGLNPSGDFL